MDYSKRNYVQEREDIKVATGELVFLIDWTIHHSQMAGQLAVEIREVARRYVEEPTPDVEFRSVIPIAVWNRFKAACMAAEGTNLNEQACYEKLEDLFFRAISSLIEQYMHE